MARVVVPGTADYYLMTGTRPPSLGGESRRMVTETIPLVANLADTIGNNQMVGGALNALRDFGSTVVGQPTGGSLVSKPVQGPQDDSGAQGDESLPPAPPQPPRNPGEDPDNQYGNPPRGTPNLRDLPNQVGVENSAEGQLLQLADQEKALHEAVAQGLLDEQSPLYTKKMGEIFRKRHALRDTYPEKTGATPKRTETVRGIDQDVANVRQAIQEAEDMHPQKGTPAFKKLEHAKKILEHLLEIRGRMYSLTAEGKDQAPYSKEPPGTSTQSPAPVPNTPFGAPLPGMSVQSVGNGREPGVMYPKGHPDANPVTPPSNPVTPPSSPELIQPRGETTHPVIPPQDSKVDLFSQLLDHAEDRGDLLSLARMADTPEKQARLLQHAKDLGVHRPRTLYEWMSGDHEVRGAQALSSMFPHLPKGESELDRLNKESMIRTREANQKSSEGYRKDATARKAEHERKWADFTQQRIDIARKRALAAAKAARAKAGGDPGRGAKEAYRVAKDEADTAEKEATAAEKQIEEHQKELNRAKREAAEAPSPGAEPSKYEDAHKDWTKRKAEYDGKQAALRDVETRAPKPEAVTEARARRNLAKSLREDLKAIGDRVRKSYGEPAGRRDTKDGGGTKDGTKDGTTGPVPDGGGSWTPPVVTPAPQKKPSGDPTF